MLRIISLNLNGIRSAWSKNVLPWSVAQAPDIVCLQEIKAAPGQVPDLLRMLPEYWSYWHGAGGYSGVAMLVHRSVAAAEPAVPPVLRWAEVASTTEMAKGRPRSRRARAASVAVRAAA